MNRGAALPVTLLMLALASAMAAGGAYVARTLATSARVAQRGTELEPQAEHAIVNAVAAWDTAARSEQPIGAVAEITPSSAAPGDVRVWVTRLADRTYWLVAEANSVSKPVLRRRLGLLVRVVDGHPAVLPQRAWSELP